MLLLISINPFIWSKSGGGYSYCFQITNDDNAGFCGIPTRNSVSRILCELKKEGVIKIENQKIVILDIDYLKQYVQC